MALTNAEKQQRWRERREELVRHAIVEDDTDRDIARKIVDAIGIDRFRDLAKAMPGLLAAEEKRSAPKTKVVKAYTLADYERSAPGGKLQWYEPNKRWHRLRARAVVPRSGDEVDVLQYEILTKHESGLFPVRHLGFTGGLDPDYGWLHKEGRLYTDDEEDDDEVGDAATLEEAKARAQLHFERRLAGLERAPDEA